MVALVVTCNRLAQLQVTLARLLAAPAADLAAVLVVDNASQDGSGAWLAAQADPRLQVLTLPENRGGAGGFEAGLRHVRRTLDPDWVLLMDDDARPEPGALAAFRARPRSGCEAWLAAVRHPDGRICEMNRPWVNPFWAPAVLWRSLRAGRAGFHLPDAAYAAAAPRPVDGGSFVGLFLSRQGQALAGLPDGRLFLYGDDVLYTLRLRAAGGRIAFDPGLRFEHDSATFGQGAALRPLWKAYYYHRNQILVYRQAAGGLLIWPVLLWKYLAWRRGARAYGAERAAFLRLLNRAVADAVRRRYRGPPGTG
nr:glycosyltransferase [Frigidibacter sp. ROC022]